MICQRERERERERTSESEKERETEREREREHVLRHVHMICESMFCKNIFFDEMSCSMHRKLQDLCENATWHVRMICQNMFCGKISRMHQILEDL